MNWDHLNEIAAEEVNATLEDLPAPLRERARPVAVTFEHVPNAGLLADGIEADTLGLFCGPEFAEEEHTPMPPQIILFLDNIWDMTKPDEEAFRDEVCITYMHEMGHYLGLNEDELTDRGLD